MLVLVAGLKSLSDTPFEAARLMERVAGRFSVI